MDMLYSRYSNPLDLVNMYINQGRFGTFVKGFLDAEYKRKVEEAEKDKDLKLWIAYVHSDSKESFGTWKNNICKTDSKSGKPNGDENLDDEGIQNIIENLFPQTKDRKNGGGS